MAHPAGTGTSARAQRLTSLVAITLVATAIGFAFGRVFLGHGATYRILLVGIASGVVAWAFERRSLLLATLVSAAALVAVLAIAVFPATTWFGVPTLETLRSIGHAAALVGEEARTKVSPASPQDTALMLAALTAVWAAVFSCYALAFRAGSPLLSFVPPIALIAFADSVLDAFHKPLYGVLFLLAALAVLFADSLRRIQGWGPVWSAPGSRNRLLPSAGRNARRVGAGALILATISPLIVPGFGSKAVIDISSINSAKKISISPLVQIGAVLNARKPFPVFSIHAAEGSYWRMAALEHLDPDTATFQQLPEPGTPVAAGGRLSGADGLTGTSVVQDVSVEASLQDFPFVVAASRATSVSIDATWDGYAETLTVPDALDAGTRYQVTSTYVDPTAADLDQVPMPAPTDYREAADYPTTSYPPVIRKTAMAWTRDQPTLFDKVLAIQNTLHSWSYSTTSAYPLSPLGVTDFLAARSGFCQHFAVAMALLLRSINIPARVVIGFTTGEKDQADPTLWHVTTSDIHSWVEVPFGKYGWLTFEPTPGTQFRDPSTDSYLNPSTGVGECPPSNRACHQPTDTDTPTPTPSPSLSGPDKNGTALEQRSHGLGGGAIPVPAAATGPHRTPYPVVFGWLLLLGLLLAALVPVSRWWKRRGGRGGAPHEEPRRLILTTYDVFAERAGDLGVGPEPGETPFEYARRMGATGRLDDGNLERMTGAVVRAAYAPEDPDADVAADVTADADRVIRELRRGTPLRRKLLGIYRRD
jgi:transglutaminase-like putative cysteine protease